MTNNQKIYIIDTRVILGEIDKLMLLDNRIKEHSLRPCIIKDVLLEYMIANTLTNVLGYNVVTRYIDLSTIEPYIKNNLQYKIWIDRLWGLLSDYVKLNFNQMYYLRTINIHHSTHIIIEKDDV